MEETFKSYKNLINLYNKNVWNNKSGFLFRYLV